MSARPYNFSAGPAILPPVVFERAAAAIHELKRGGHDPSREGIGLSILEISHRDVPYDEVHEKAERLCHEVLAIPETHQVLFFGGGASQQFAQIPMNLRREGRKLAYVDTGVWAKKAIEEAQPLGEVDVIASSKASGHDHIPAIDMTRAEGASYLHLTTNNTIFGTEYESIPTAPSDVPLVIDCSSHIGSRPLDFSKVGLGYAGAQKNLGPSGLTLVFIRKDLLALEPVGVVPRIFRYQTHTDPPSRYNTPNTFGILVLALVLEWMKDLGGLDALAARNDAKAKHLYDALDASTLFRAHAKPGSRSRMNVTFTLAGAAEDQREALTKRFLSEAKAAGFDGLKGHRLVGGCRASIYNAFPQDGVDALVTFMREFERRA